MGLAPGSAVCDTAAPDLISLRCFQSRLVAFLPAKSMVLHSVACWQGSRCDSAPARFSSQLWRMSSPAVNAAVPLQSPDVHSSLGCWQRRRFDFHSLPANAPKGLLCCRDGQDDSRQLAHAGLLAAADGSADLRANHQGTGFVVTVGADYRIIMELSAPAGHLQVAQFVICCNVQ